MFLAWIIHLFSPYLNGFCRKISGISRRTAAYTLLGGMYMYQGKSRRCCVLMLTVSICLRICMFLGLDAKATAFLAETARKPDFARFLLYLETGRVLPAEAAAPEPEVIVLRYLQPVPRPGSQPEPPAEEAPDEPEPQPEPLLPETLAAAEQITVAGGCTYTFDQSALLARPSAMDLSGEGPKVLIVHTHGSEAYTPEPGWEYQALVDHRTLDTDRSVIAVGDALAAALEARGIEVLHDRTLNDYPSYNDAYWTCLRKIEDWQAQYPGIQMVIDLHRDAVEDPAGGAKALSCVQNGETAAQLMLVVGTDQGGLSHPDWQENLANALKLQSVLEGHYPGLCRSLDLRTERFNQHAAPGSVLVEVGTNGNTLRQALRSAEFLGDGIARMLHALSQNGGTLTG